MNVVIIKQQPTETCVNSSDIVSRIQTHISCTILEKMFYYLMITHREREGETLRRNRRRRSGRKISQINGQKLVCQKLRMPIKVLIIATTTIKKKLYPFNRSEIRWCPKVKKKTINNVWPCTKMLITFNWNWATSQQAFDEILCLVSPCYKIASFFQLKIQSLWLL